MDVIYLSLLLTFLLSPTKAQNVFVAAPSVIRLDVEEKVAIAVDGTSVSQNFEVFVQDHPGKRKNLSTIFDTVLPNNPKILTIKVSSSDIQDYLTPDPSVRSFVSVVVHSNSFQREFVLPVSYQAGYIFIHTDKPIYTPQQTVKFRIISLDEEGRPSSTRIKFQIKNPKDYIVQETEFSGKTFITPEPYTFPKYPLFGIWSANVLYGYKYQQNATIQFELREYVLPTFDVTLKVQEVILPSDKTISIAVEAKYVYGKPVSGTLVLQFGIKRGPLNATFFRVDSEIKLENGRYKTKIDTDLLKNQEKVGWFPEIEGAQFVVEAAVTDEAAGRREVVTSTNSHFSTSPFVISFKRSLIDFKPGLVSLIEADINFVDGRPASGIKATISAVVDDNIPLKITHPESVSDGEGKVMFEVQPEIHHKRVTVTVQTNDERYVGNQAIGYYTQYKFESKNNAYIAITRKSNNKVTPGSKFSEVIHIEPPDISDMYYMVVARGSTLLMNKLHQGKFKVQMFEFMVTHDMVPSFRIVAFAEYKNELIVDSLRIDVENECDPKAEVSIVPDFGKIKEPGSTGKIIIQGTKSTVVGLLGVDSAVYALSNRDQLTKSKMFKTFDSHDLGCGPGGGLTTESVLRNAGIVMVTNHYTANSMVSACSEIVRKRRSVMKAKLNEFQGILRECCALGMINDKYNRECQNRADILKEQLQENDGNCSQTFLECCLHREEQKISSTKPTNTRLQTGRIGSDRGNSDFIPIELEEEEEHESLTLIRSDFRETWIFEDFIIGPDGKEEFQLSLPHSITTWVIQAVAVSQSHGMCIPPPQQLESFQKIFLQLDIPYSVIKNEQIEIRATVFYYGDKQIRASVYMYGVKDLCTGAQEGEKTERKVFMMEPHSAESVTFPVVPLMEGIYDIKVVVLSSDGNDVIIRKLNVVSEGIPVVREITVKLDPSNQQRRVQRHIVNPNYADSIDDSQNLQVTAITLKTPANMIPGTESCTITALGDQFGPTVQTTLENPESILKMPTGCAEQAMMYLGPTLYTMRYLKSTNKITPEMEDSGYKFIRKGYDLILSYRKDDGSYGAWAHTPQSTWLTAFISKVFCQASQLVHIDNEVVCGSVRWLVSGIQEDGSFVEPNPVYHKEMMGGVVGNTPLTAFVLITLYECKCEIPNMHIIKARALAYLEENLGDINTPLPLAIATYALALSDSELKETINDKLMFLSKYDEGANTLYWETDSNSYNVEASSYALLAQLQLMNMDKSNSIVNWLNTQQMSSGSFHSTQDTSIALQALSEYSIRSRTPGLSLVSNLTSNNDRNFHKTFVFNEKNALVLQEHKVDKIGTMLFVSTSGRGVGSLSVKHRYNVPKPQESDLKFDVKVNVTDEKENEKYVIEPIGVNEIVLLQSDLIRAGKEALDAPIEEIALAIDPRNRPRPSSRIRQQNATEKLRRMKRSNVMNSNQILGLNICAKYLGDHEPGMSIVDVGLFSGFKADEQDLNKLVKQDEIIQYYEKSSRGIVFYLDQVPSMEYYCFKFRINQDTHVGNTHAGIVKIYSYYDPDESKSVFYSPNQDSPLLRKICSGTVCQCAEGGCPPEHPFQKIGRNYNDLKRSACEDHDYVWIVEVVDPGVKNEGFLNIQFRVIDVAKEGIEKSSLLVNEMRTFLARDDCATAALFPNKQYIIMGNDGKKYETDDGKTGYRYLLDKSSKIHVWTDHSSTDSGKRIMRLLRRLKVQLQKGCDM